MKNYNVPSAGSDGNYGAPTPHAANVFHDPFTAPEGDLDEMTQGWHMAEGDHSWTDKTHGMVKGSTDFNAYE